MATRAYEAGKETGRAIIKTVHLMYQNNTAKNFFSGLMHTLSPEYKKRMSKTKKK